MAKRRIQLRASDHQPAPRARFYIHKPEKVPVSRTVRTPENPWHEGIHDAKRSGARMSRGECFYPAKHSTERMADVCTDFRMRERLRKERMESNSLKAMYRRWGLDIK